MCAWYNIMYTHVLLLVVLVESFSRLPYLDIILLLFVFVVVNVWEKH